MTPRGSSATGLASHLPKVATAFAGFGANFALPMVRFSWYLVRGTTDAK